MRWVLVAAFALSVLVHAILALLVHAPRPSAGQEKLAYAQRTVIVHMTPPPRTPSPRKQPIAPPRIASTLPQPSTPAVMPTPIPTPPPTPTPAPVTHTPASRCVTPDAPAALAGTPPPPEIPPGVRALGINGTAAVQVQIAPDGSVTGATIAATTGDPSFDAIAIAMARDAQYEPARHACKEIASSYLFRVQFAPW